MNKGQRPKSFLMALLAENCPTLRWHDSPWVGWSTLPPWAHLFGIQSLIPLHLLIQRRIPFWINRVGERQRQWQALEMFVASPGEARLSLSHRTEAGPTHKGAPPLSRTGRWPRAAQAAGVASGRAAHSSCSQCPTAHPHEGQLGPWFLSATPHRQAQNSDDVTPKSS